MGFLLARYQDLDVYVPYSYCLFHGFVGLWASTAAIRKGVQLFSPSVPFYVLLNASKPKASILQFHAQAKASSEVALNKVRDPRLMALNLKPLTNQACRI